MVLTWTPTGTGAPVTELVEIEATDQLNLSEFTISLKALYPRAYEALSDPADRLDTVIRLAQDEMRVTLAARGLDLARLKDQRLLIPPLVSLVALKWALGGDEKTADEQEVISRAYSAALESLCKLPVWVDMDGDGTQDDEEVSNYPIEFERVW